MDITKLDNRIIEFGIRLQDFSNLYAGYSSYLAGGAPRDLILDRNIRDYDFYITYDSEWCVPDEENFTKKLLDMISDFGNSYCKRHMIENGYDFEYESEEDAEESDLLNVINFKSFSGDLFIDDDLNIQVIILGIPFLEYIDQFDIGLCKIYMRFPSSEEINKEHIPNILTMTAEFIEDMNNKTLTITGQSNSPHANKIKMKYPTYRVVDKTG